VNGIPVFFEAAEVGTIESGPDGPSFRYSPRWQRTPRAFDVSLTMPLDGGLYGPGVLVPWLLNLMPEGDPLRAVGRSLGVSTEDVVGLATRIGGETAGALSIGRPREGEHPGYRRIADAAALERIIEELPRKPFLAGDDGVSMSLAGTQDKLPVAVDPAGPDLRVPLNGAASTHILKPDSDRLFGSVQNEALCMVLARRAGLRAASVTTGTAGRRSYLLVERFDRFPQAGTWRRSHQEDFCQALGLPPAAKYEHNQTGTRGPSLRDLTELSRARLTPRSTVELVDAIVFNVLIANVDAHAKNYAISLPFRPGQPSLAALYDLMCGAAWDGITQNQSQSIGGQRNGRHIHGRHWDRMAADCGLGAAAVRRRVRALARTVLDETDAASREVEAMPAGGHAMLGQFADAIRRRATTVLGNLEVDAPGQADDG